MSDFSSIFGVTTLREPFNRAAALYLQANISDYVLDPIQQATSKDRIDRLITQSRGESFNRVAYKKAAAVKRHGKGAVKASGRWFAETPGAMQGMPRRVRQTICDGLWIDIDFVNCHPVILAGICRNHGIHSQLLEKYIKDRENMLQEMVENGVPNRDEAKQRVLKALNGGSVNDVNVPWWKDIRKEFANIAMTVALQPHYNDYLQECKDDKRLDYNLNARVMNAVLCNEENKCLEELFACLKEEGLVMDQCSLIFDGLMILDNPTNRQKISLVDFFGNISDRIHKVTGHQLVMKVKEFDESYELPEDYADSLSDVFVIDQGDDLQAADEFVRRHKDRLVSCHGRTFWEEEGVYTEDAKMVKNGILSALSRMNIVTRVKEGLIPYSRNIRRAEDCTKYILADKSIEQPDFVDKLFSSSLGYLAFEDGVFSFELGEFLPHPAQGVYFTAKINRPFPTKVDPGGRKRLMEMVIEPIFPVKERRDYFLHRCARALAGEVYDKKWHVCTGERNSGKGVIADCLALAFGPFVQTINSENLLCKAVDNGDAAKAQSWMSPLEFKRIAFSNECKMQGGRAR
jgi:hypothetical protein